MYHQFHGMSDSFANGRRGVFVKNTESQTIAEPYARVAPVVVPQLNLCKTQAIKEGIQRQEHQYRRPYGLKKPLEYYQYA